LSRSDFCGERVLEAAEATGLAYVSGINRYLCDRNAHLEKGYRAFAHHFAAFDDLSNAPSLSTADCFIVRTLLIHWFRRVTLHDPQIPAELLPEDWPGHYAYELCHRIYRRIYREAETFLAQTVGASGGALPELSPWFFQRFGGLI